jgi:transposase-like protein
MKTQERERARRLRRDRGLSVKELARALGDSKSTISLWVRDIELSDEQHAKLAARSSWGRLAGSRTNAARGLARRNNAQSEGRARAQRGGTLHVAGCMLYWAEGSRSRNSVEFVNSDPAMMKFFLHFLRSILRVPDTKVSLRCNLFVDHQERQRDIEDFWLESLGLPPACLRRSTVNRFSKYSKKKRQNKLPYGTCRLTVCDTRIVQHIYGAIQEYAGFDREEWVM